MYTSIDELKRTSLPRLSPNMPEKKNGSFWEKPTVIAAARAEKANDDGAER